MISFQLPHIEKKYTTKELFNHFNMDINSEISNSGQYLSGILIMKNHNNIMNIVDECINVLRSDHLLITDHYNQLNQCSEFIDNRHDQSILSLSRKKYGSIILSDETWFTPFGNKESMDYPFWATRIKK